MNNIKIIVAVDQNNGIGYKGNLLFHIKEDFKNFVKKTKGKYKKRTDKIENSLIIGKNTFLSFPKRKSGSRALLHRHNCVVGNILTEEIKKEMSDGNILFVNSLKKALRKTRDRKEIWIGGGSRIYKESLEIADEIYLTRIFAEKKSDTFFPEIDTKIFKRVWASSIKTCTENKVKFRFEVYKRR